MIMHLRACTLALVACLLAACAAKSVPAASFVFSPTMIVPPTNQYPGSTGFVPTGIRGPVAIGGFLVTGGVVTGNAASVSNSSNGAVWNPSTNTWTSINVPVGVGSNTLPYGPDITSVGYLIVGSYSPPASSLPSSFIYNSATGTYTTYQPSAMTSGGSPFCLGGCKTLILHSAYGDVSNYMAVGNTDNVLNPPGPGVYPTTGHAVLYTAATATWSLIDYPGAASTTAYGIWTDGSTTAVAGGYVDLSGGVHAYVRDLFGTNTMSYQYPGATITHFEGITGNGGAGNYNVIGNFVLNGAEQGFFMTITGWQAGTPVVLGSPLSANSVYQRTVVGISPLIPPFGYMGSVP